MGVGESYGVVNPYERTFKRDIRPEDCFIFDLTTLAIGVDSLLGGDALHESGKHHVIVDTWTSGLAPPQIYFDPYSERLRSNGIKALSTSEINRYIKKHNLLELPRITTRAVSDEMNITQTRRNYLLHLVDSLEIMLDHIVATTEHRKRPSFEEKRYRATRKHESSNLVDPKEAREKLREELSKRNYHTKTKKQVREQVLKWQADQGFIPPEQVAQRFTETINILKGAFRENVLPNLRFDLQGYNKDLADLTLEGYRIETLRGEFFTASNIYQGGETEDGKPALRGLFEYNLDHPVTPTVLLHIAGHEVMPGHWVNSVFSDLLYRDGRLGFESTMQTMCTPGNPFQEGWAQAAFEILYGSREAAAEVHGQDLLVELALDDLQDIAKHNVGLLYQRDGKSINQVRDHVAYDCSQADSIVNKMSRSWSRHPIIASMYGSAYYLGRTTLARAIEDKGRDKVVRIGLGAEGPMDLQTFSDNI